MGHPFAPVAPTPSVGVVALAIAFSVAVFAPGSSAAAADTGVAAGNGQGQDREWVTHTVVPGESWASIASRYGVSVGALRRWNKKRLPESGMLIANRTKLKIHARNPPPPRERIGYVVQKGDTFWKIAKEFGVPQDHLRRWNRKKKGLRVGDTLTVYTDPREPPPPPPKLSSDPDAPLPTFDVRAGGYGVGKPNRGRLVGGVRLPDNDMYVLRKPDAAFGTTHAVQVIMTSVARFRRDTGWDRPVEIGALSRQNGGRFRPHSSHQTGRDADIRLPKLGGVPLDKSPTVSEIDWGATWHLIKAFVDTGQVEFIFLSYRRQRYLYRAARAAGASAAELGRLIQYPRGPRHNSGLVRHAEGHDVHMHVRIRCSPGNDRCLTY